MFSARDLMRTNARFNPFKWIVLLAVRGKDLREMRDEWRDPGSEPNDLMIMALGIAVVPMAPLLLGGFAVLILEAFGVSVPLVAIQLWAAFWFPFVVGGVLGFLELGIVNILAERGVGRWPLLTAADFMESSTTFIPAGIGCVVGFIWGGWGG